ASSTMAGASKRPRPPHTAGKPNRHIAAHSTRITVCDQQSRLTYRCEFVSLMFAITNYFGDLLQCLPTEATHLRCSRRRQAPISMNVPNPTMAVTPDMGTAPAFAVHSARGGFVGDAVGTPLPSGNAATLGQRVAAFFATRDSGERLVGALP